jgi:hypothetical protein
MHKLEAIRLINEALSTGGEIPEAIIFAIQSLIQEASELLKNDSGSGQSKVDNTMPFKLPLLPLQG